ncbi:hypothetical protein CK203_022446 [Vitis vinifera]|uniref:Uncharacterized protein n=1 Tax=Vitis vinifera TaxID=29760 RepID=A0A438I9F4_VITVI|nr:hypothetical protein CK203_022446 [Vitis vinifera]
MYGVEQGKKGKGGGGKVLLGTRHLHLSLLNKSLLCNGTGGMQLKEEPFGIGSLVENIGEEDGGGV